MVVLTSVHKFELHTLGAKEYLLFPIEALLGMPSETMKI
jgi:hypothetical protein